MVERFYPVGRLGVLGKSWQLMCLEGLPVFGELK